MTRVAPLCQSLHSKAKKKCVHGGSGWKPWRWDSAQIFDRESVRGTPDKNSKIFKVLFKDNKQ